eukprot:15434951-Alexandrium_andersonii.AAC.1
MRLLVLVDQVQADDKARDHGGHLLPCQLAPLARGDAHALELVADSGHGLVEVIAADALLEVLVHVGLAEGPLLVAPLLPLGRAPGCEGG